MSGLSGCRWPSLGYHYLGIVSTSDPANSRCPFSVTSGQISVGTAKFERHWMNSALGHGRVAELAAPDLSTPYSYQRALTDQSPSKLHGSRLRWLTSGRQWSSAARGRC